MEMREVNHNELPMADGGGGGGSRQLQPRTKTHRVLFHVFSALVFIWLLHTIIARKDMSQFFLGSCVLSVFVGLLSYELMIAARNRNSTNCHSSCGYIVMFYIFVFVLWGAAGYFFVVVETTNKGKKPADNRDLNKECILAGFYDSHCIWHFLSSNALLLSGLRAIYLSYPCRKCKVEEEERDKGTPSIDRVHIEHVTVPNANPPRVSMRSDSNG